MRYTYSMKLEMSLDEVNDKLCDVYANNLREGIDDLLLGGIKPDFFWQFFNYRNRVVEAGKLTNQQSRLKVYFDICIDFFNIFEQFYSEIGIGEIKVYFPGEDDVFSMSFVITK